MRGPARRAAHRGVRLPRLPRPPEGRRRVPRDHRVAPQRPLPAPPRPDPVDVDRAVRPRPVAGQPPVGPEDPARGDALLPLRRGDVLPVPDGLPGPPLAARGAPGALRAPDPGRGAGGGGPDGPPARAEDLRRGPPARAEGEDLRVGGEAARVAPVLPPGRGEGRLRPPRADPQPPRRRRAPARRPARRPVAGEAPEVRRRPASASSGTRGSSPTPTAPSWATASSPSTSPSPRSSSSST